MHKDGYPFNNILFEDSQTAEVMRILVNDAEQLHQILMVFIHHKPTEVLAFKKDIPDIVQRFRALFDEQNQTNTKYKVYTNTQHWKTSNNKHRKKKLRPPK